MTPRRAGKITLLLTAALGLILIASIDPSRDVRHSLFVLTPQGESGEGDELPDTDTRHSDDFEDTEASGRPENGLSADHQASSEADEAGDQIVWLDPVQGAAVGGDFTVEVAAPHNTTHVQFSVIGNSEIQQSVTSQPWSTLVDASSFEDGAYEIVARAYAADGSLVARSRAVVEIDNTNADPTVVRHQDGYDWYLPAGLEPAPRSGIYGYGSLNDIMTIQTPMLSWSALHLGPGEFNWDRLDRLMEKGPVVLRLKCGSPNHVPSFIRARNPGWQTFINTSGRVELPQWQQGWLEEWQAFVTEFGKRYADHPDFVGLQLQITASGEPFMTQSNALAFERVGMTPSVLRDFLLRYHEVSLNAFPGNEWKVFSVVRQDFLSSYAGAYSVEQYNEAIRDATLPMLQRGMGLRGSGDTEQYEVPSSWPDWTEFQLGMVVTHDDSFPPLVSQGRVDGQIENWYGGNQHSGIVTDNPEKLRYAMRMSLLRALADQYSFIWMDSDDLKFVGDDIARYAQLSLGHRPETAPDASLVLGEFGPLEAMPRWLQPLNLHGSGRGEFMNTQGLNFVGDSNFIGRAFDNHLLLALDDRFLSPDTEHDVKVAVTYLDTGSSWHLEYESDGAVKSSPIIQGDGTGTWRTVTIRLPSATFSGALEGNADLRIVSSDGAVTIHVVRVIR